MLLVTYIWRHSHFRDTDELRQGLLHVWQGLEQSLLMMMQLNNCPMPLRDRVPDNDGHFEHSLWLAICFHFTWWTLCHATLDAVGNIPIVHYKSMKCDVSFSQGSVSTLFMWGVHVIRVCAKMFFLLTAVQKLFFKIKGIFQELWTQICCHVCFMKHSVYLY